MARKIPQLGCCFVLIGCIAHSEVSAQTSQAGISGTVVDDKKETIPGATVQARNEATGFTTYTVTNPQGEYTFKQLPLGGPYTVKVSFVGFGTQKKSGYTLNLARFRSRCTVGRTFSPPVSRLGTRGLKVRATYPAVH